MKRHAWVAPLMLLALSGCLDAPTPGEIAVELTTPNTDDGAIMFVVHAAAPSQLRGAEGACDGCLAFAHAVSPNELRVIVTGPLVSGRIATVQVAHAAPISGYRIEITQVARRDYETRLASGYRLELAR